MAIAELFTKRKLADVKETDDTLDREYHNRLEQIRSTDALRQLLEDYEEFLPEGIQRFRNATDKCCEELIKGVHRVISFAKRGEVLAEPTEAAMLFSPPMISMPRNLAISLMMDERKKGRKVKMTWGMAFKQMAIEGFITKLATTQERMYRKTIEFQEMVKEQFDTNCKPEDPCLRTPQVEVAISPTEKK